MVVGKWMMRRQRTRLDSPGFIDQIRAKQRNILWPDTVVNGRAVDVFLWRGSPDPTIVQRIGAWLFGLLFLALSVGFLDYALRERSFVLVLFSLGWILLGARVFRNGFRRRKGKAETKEDRAGSRQRNA
jgi:hypothetical protein